MARSPDASNRVRAGRRNGPPGCRPTAGLARIFIILRATRVFARLAPEILMDQPRRRRAFAALGPARVCHYARATLALITGVAFLLGGFGIFSVCSPVHRISPRARPADLITLDHAPTNEP